MQEKRLKLSLCFIAIAALTVVQTKVQAQELKVKVIDTKEVTTVVRNVSSSSSSSCHTSDFPVYQGSTRTDVDFNDLKKIIVRHDKPADDPNNYLTVELVNKKGESGLYEMIKAIRITGLSDEGDFSVKVVEVKSVEVL